MDPLSVSISSIFGLLATFLQERERRKDAAENATIREYMEWLRRGEHAEAVSLLESNRDLTAAVQNLLEDGRAELLDRFDRLEGLLAEILGSSGEWGPLVRSVNPKAGLSDQAIEVLRWFDTTGASHALELNTREVKLLCPDTGNGNYVPSELRFFEDDMNNLVGLGLLILDYGSKGSRIFRVTRAAIDVVAGIPQPPDSTTATEVD